MEEGWIKDFLHLVTEVGKPIVTLLLVYLTLRVPVVNTLLTRFVNGQKKNGAPKDDTAGKASVEFWQSTIRRALAETLVDYETDANRRQAELMQLLREMRDANTAGFEKVRTRIHEVASPISAAVLALERERQESRRSGRG